MPDDDALAHLSPDEAPIITLSSFLWGRKYWLYL